MFEKRQKNDATNLIDAALDACEETFTGHRMQKVVKDNALIVCQIPSREELGRVVVDDLNNTVETYLSDCSSPSEFLIDSPREVLKKEFSNWTEKIMELHRDRL